MVGDQPNLCSAEFYEIVIVQGQKSQLSETIDASIPVQATTDSNDVSIPAQDR